MNHLSSRVSASFVPAFRSCLVTGALLVGLLTRPPLIARGDTSFEELRRVSQAAVQDYDQERYAAAIPKFDRAVALARAILGPESYDTTSLIMYAANCRVHMRDLAEADDRYRQCLKIFRRQPAKADNRRGIADCLFSQGNIYRIQGRYAASEEAFQQALQAAVDAQQRATIQQNYAYLWEDQKEYEKAREQFRAAAGYWRTQSGADAKLQLANCDHGIGFTLFVSGEFDASRTWLQKALAVRQRLLPEDHKLTGFSEGMLALTFVMRGEDSTAEPLLERSRRRMEAYWQGNHIEVADLWQELALLWARRGDIDRAIPQFTRVRKTYRRHIRHSLMGLSEPQQLRFLVKMRPPTQSALAVAAAHRGRPGVASHSLEWLLNDKALAQEVLAERELLARNRSLNPKLAQTVRELEDVRRQLASLASNSPSGSKLKQLQTRQNELLRAVGLEQLRQNERSAWITVDQVASALPDESVLIEIARLESLRAPLSEFAPRESSPAEARYLAWTLRRNGSVQLYDLGPAEPIDQAIETLRDRIASAREDVELDAQGAKKLFDDTARELARRIIDPLLPQLKDSGQWIVSPDSKLWLAPWSALVLPDGKHVVEHAAITHLVSGRELVRGKTGPSRWQPGDYGTLFADPDFDLSADTMKALSRQVLKDQQDMSRFRARGVDTSRVARDYRGLPFTRVEAEAIHAPMESYVGGRLYQYLGPHAMETLFKKITRPKVAVLATHGYFLEPRGDDATSPLMRCGLILAGANRRQPGTADDGVLTGLEVLQSDLRGTQLVVLSACDTAVGAIHSGEGVAGLRQAFQLAGANTVVATLWQVDDAATAELMTRFWNEMGRGAAPDSALRTAQLALLKSSRNPAANHPYFWAAATITGSPAGD